MQTPRRTREDWTLLRAALIANRNDICEDRARFPDVENALCALARNVDPDLRHRLDHERIKGSRFEAGALCFELVAADVIHPGLGHLAACTVVDADEENALFHWVTND